MVLVESFVSDPAEGMIDDCSIDFYENDDLGGQKLVRAHGQMPGGPLPLRWFCASAAGIRHKSAKPV